jgi:hypothetical protein
VTVYPWITRLCYLQPQYFDVLRSVEIRVARLATVRTGEAFACARTKMQTAVTYLGGIRRWPQMLCTPVLVFALCY